MGHGKALKEGILKELEKKEKGEAINSYFNLKFFLKNLHFLDRTKFDQRTFQLYILQI